MTTKTMTAKYPGYCRTCKGAFPIGADIRWSKETGAQHMVCPQAQVKIGTSFDTFKAQVAVSDAMTDLAEARRKEAPDANLVPGVYEVAGEVYVVKYNREKTNLYAKRLVGLNYAGRVTEAGTKIDIDFEYDKGAIFNITLNDRMPVERAKELTTLYGKCIACGIRLKAGKSVENGIGPVCIKKFGPVLNPKVETADGRTISLDQVAA
jgi:hypothetical protein